MAVGTIISSVSYDGAGFAKVPVVIDSGQHDSADSSVAAHDLASFVGMIWREASMVFSVPISTPLSLLIMSVIATKVELVLFLVLIVLPTEWMIWL